MYCLQNLLQLEKEIRELIKQRDLAQSQVKELLLLVRDDGDTRKSVSTTHCAKFLKFGEM